MSATTPSLKMRMVGMARISYLLAISLLLSTLTLQILTESLSSMASSSSMGAIALQGPHQGAQKSTMTGTEPSVTVDSKLELSSSVILSDIISWFGWLVELEYYRNGMTSCASKTVKAMATAAAIASTMIAPTFRSLSSSIEIDESTTGELAGFVTAGLGAIDTLIGAGIASAGGSVGFARTTRGLFGLLSADPSGKVVVLDESSGFEASADPTCSESGAGVLLAESSILEVDPRVSDSFLF